LKVIVRKLIPPGVILYKKEEFWAREGNNEKWVIKQELGINWREGKLEKKGKIKSG